MKPISLFNQPAPPSVQRLEAFPFWYLKPSKLIHNPSFVSFLRLRLDLYGLLINGTVYLLSIAETECYKQQRPLSWHTDMFIVSQALHRIRQIICCTKDMHIEKIKKYNLVIVNILHWADKGKQTSLSEQLQKLYCFNLVFCFIMITCP